jgi:hypothetical protein
MEAPISPELILGVGAIAVALLAIYLFMRATGGGKGSKKVEGLEVEKASAADVVEGPAAPPVERHQAGEVTMRRYIQPEQVERARSEIRLLTLRRELLSMALKRLFEAEDLGEITREERIRLSKEYEDEMKRVGEEIKRSELILSLHELENIRQEVIKKFEATLNNTQARIDAILKELKMGELKAEPPAQPEVEKKRRRPKEEGKEEVKEGVKEEVEKPKAPKRSEIDEKLEQLRREVLKELEELERLDIEV